MSAAAEGGAGPRRVDARAGAHADLPRAVLRLLHCDGAVRSLYHAAEGGDIVHVRLGERESFRKAQRQRDDDHAPLVVKLHRTQQLRLQRKPLLRFGAEVALVRRAVVNTRLHQRGGYAVRVRRHVGVDEAARVRTDRDVERQGDGRCELSQLDRQFVENFAAGGTLRVDAAFLSEALIARMVVDGKIDPVLKALRVVGEQPQRREIDGDDRFIAVVLRRPIGRDVIGIEARDLGVRQQRRRFAHLPQHGAQRCGAAERVAVGAAVGQDQVAVMRAQKGGDLLDRHSSSPSSTICSFAGFAGLTFVGSRSISRMCAPYSMESSAVNCSSGV